MIRRTRLKPRGKQSLRESKVSPDHERLLQLFWARVEQYTVDGQQHKILAMLREYEAIPGRKVASRYNFDRIKHRFKTAGYTCLVCTEDAQVRHHIIALGKGGPNARANVAALCEVCHGKIHPHLSTGDSR
jgi:5-methylcytosine-specific restriction endonuclease McrA